LSQFLAPPDSSLHSPVHLKMEAQPAPEAVWFFGLQQWTVFKILVTTVTIYLIRIL
jgi:hypothetical protein